MNHQHNIVSTKTIMLLFAPACVLGLLTSPQPAQGTDQLPSYPTPALGERLTQAQVTSGDLSLRELRREGMRIFSTPFNKLDGLGDGPINPLDKVSPGGRPTLQNNGIFLRMNGLDSQSCVECHSILSSLVVPPLFAVGGVGGVSQSAFPGIIDPDIDDSDDNGFASTVGRVINPPFSFGSGGVELVGKEMTQTLQDLADDLDNSDSVPLVAKGVAFGTLSRDAQGNLDVSAVEGIDDDLVVRPFGRTGCCATVRTFDLGALQFHHGIQPSEVVGAGVDADGDGVSDEILVGEVSAMHIFQVALRRPLQTPVVGAAVNGEALFGSLGCASCHIPELITDSHHLPLTFPEVPTEPFANEFFDISLHRSRPGFDHDPNGDGVIVALFADLKRHDMGPGLAEGDGNAEFTTARLWGVADTAPYLHDGRAPDLTTAIELHGGEGQSARDAFVALSDADKGAVLAFLRTLQTPYFPNTDL